MPTLICYDIGHDGLRTRIGQKIVEYGLTRINLSVYLGAIRDTALTRLEKWLHDEMAKAAPGDSLLILPMTTHQVAQMQVLGTNALEMDELTGSRHTLIL